MSADPYIYVADDGGCHAFTYDPDADVMILYSRRGKQRTVTGFGRRLAEELRPSLRTPEIVGSIRASD